MLKKAYVVAIAAVSGGGKTTIVSTLNKRLPNSKALFFDDYQFDGPSDLCKWTESGEDCNEWDLRPLIDDLKSLIFNSIEPVEYILLDYPFAYKHDEMKKYIDLTIFIDTPLDIAMARRIVRDFKEVTTDHIIRDADFYLKHARASYLQMLNTIKPNSDFIIDGSLTVEVIVDEIYGKIEELN